VSIQDMSIQPHEERLALLERAGITGTDAETALRVFEERVLGNTESSRVYAVLMRRPTCAESPGDVPAHWRCQLGPKHGGPFHIYADEKVTMQWANGEDGYVPEECPDPSEHLDFGIDD
jgi:hypothetical protein